jgi:hypothetical protein
MISFNDLIAMIAMISMILFANKEYFWIQISCTGGPEIFGFFGVKTRHRRNY